MQIGFVEEYPTEENLGRIKKIPFLINLYLGCRSIEDFIKLRNKIKKHHNIKVTGYWPILNDDEGYWLSALSKRKAILRVLKELEDSKENFPVIWDAEVPVNNKKLFITEAFKVTKNRELIQNAIKNQQKNREFIIAQLPWYDWRRVILNFCAIDFSFNDYHRLDMLYTSIAKTENKEEFLRESISRGKVSYKKYSVGLGLIAKGEEPNGSPLLTPKELERDLEIVSEAGIQEAVIYRLGGVNKDYIKVLSKFALEK